MNVTDLKALQAPLKERYRDDPSAAVVTLRAEGRADGLSCKVATGKALVEAGLHPATGGDGTLACSGDMLLEALVACAGVTLRAVATALCIELFIATVVAEGDLVVIRVSDDGKGFDPARIRAKDPSLGFGLPSLRERIRFFGGRLDIRASEGQGTTVELSVPTRPREGDTNPGADTGDVA